MPTSKKIINAGMPNLVDNLVIIILKKSKKDPVISRPSGDKFIVSIVKQQNLGYIL